MVPADEIDEAMPARKPGEVVVQYFEDGQYNDFDKILTLFALLASTAHQRCYRRAVLESAVHSTPPNFPC